MITTSGAPRHLLRWSIVAVALLVGYLAGLVLLGLAARPGPELPGRLAAYEDPRAWWPIAVQVGLGAAAFLAYWWPRRRENRSFSFLVTGSLAVTTIGLGLVSYWGCATDQSPFWTPLTWALNLIVGGVNDSCGYPLGLQVARLFGPLLLVITGLGVLATLFRNQRDRLSVRLARRVQVVVGLSPETVGLLRRLTESAGPRTSVAVLTGSTDIAMIRSARDHGGAVIMVDPDDTRGLQVLLTAGRRFKMQGAYLMSPDSALNLRWAQQLRRVADGCAAPTSVVPPRIVVRIDDPWQAEYWRRSNGYRTRHDDRQRVWIGDALSSYEVTAALLVDRLQRADHDRLVLVGSSPLALAVSAELAQRDREDDLLGQRRRPSTADLVVVGPGAGRLRDQHALRQARFGNTVAPLRAVAEPAALPVLERLLDGCRRPAVLVTEEGTDASFLAARHPEWTIFALGPDSRGLAEEPIMEALYPYGLTTDLPIGWPVDSWERAARVVHERYRRQRDPKSPPRASDRGWDDLDPFLRESNIRLVTTTLASVESLGRSWGSMSCSADSDTEDQSISEDQRMILARLEHDSWRRHLLENGWRPGSVRDDGRRTHPALLPWAQLPDVDRQRSLANVTDAIATLRSLGYRSSVAADGEAGWRAYRRSGTVRARRSTKPWTWRSRHGDVMQAVAGDWWVSDGFDAWSVTDAVFTTTYQHLSGDRWCRIGEVDGRPARPGEIVATLEGDETAGDDDWVLRGRAGDHWIVSTAHLQENYQTVDSLLE